ncbi:glycosyltransferase [uncultured Roseobacter sp.]|uniref:glycosyltransferase family 2 protein n=1 Tax=uncultured Roseobacter sp. TaxID=114847 RepID=UPI00262ECD28|nr:glycosyltransferase [uncultured Roseobacter sp.]
MSRDVHIHAVVIGRNEGSRLIDCLDALAGQADQVIYVDSGSTDGSQAAARARGAQVVELDMSKPFTAARARNTGLALAVKSETPPRYIQFLDGDCALQPGWIETAFSFLEAHPEAAVACGRRRERFPEATIYNRMIDAEWDTPVGRALACGGDALMRTQALRAVEGYNPDLIAGEEPEMCLRLRHAGWQIWRLDAEMTLHDANITRFSQWWQRARRAGYTYAEGVAMHGSAPDHHKRAELLRTVLWGIGMPLLHLAGLIISPWLLGTLLVWPLQVLRLRLRGMDWPQAIFLTLGKLPEAQGVLTYLWRRLGRRQSRIIEYKR